MSIPEAEWVDFNSDFEEFARSAREVLSRMNPPSFMQGIISDGVFGEGHPPELDSNLPVLLQTTDNLHMLMPGMSLGSVEFFGGMLADPYPWKLPPTPRLRTIPLPLVDPWYNGGGYSGGGGGGGGGGVDDGGDCNFPGGGISDHQPTEQWTTASDRQSEASTCLAPAKPKHIENHNRSEQSSSPTSPSSRSGGYDRALNADEKTRRLAQIREALGIPSTEGELPTLLKIIQRLGGTVPKFEEPPVWLLKSQRQARKLGERRECFEELRSLVGPWTTKLYELKILNNVLAKVTSQAGKLQGPQGGYEPYGVFRARRMTRIHTHMARLRNVGGRCEG